MVSNEEVWPMTQTTYDVSSLFTDVANDKEDWLANQTTYDVSSFFVDIADNTDGENGGTYL